MRYFSNTDQENIKWDEYRAFREHVYGGDGLRYKALSIRLRELTGWALSPAFQNENGNGWVYEDATGARWVRLPNRHFICDVFHA